MSSRKILVAHDCSAAATRALKFAADVETQLGASLDAINPGVIVGQMEGGLRFGLGAALFGAITLEEGHVLQNNFDGHRVLTMPEM